MKHLAILGTIVLIGCKAGAPYEGLAAAQHGAAGAQGPQVRFDLLVKPLPEIPFPNDIATRPDPTSPTGLRVNASQVAPTQLETRVRTLLDGLDGFGCYMPISVAFDQDLDVLDFYARQNDGDASNDGVYLVDLKTGQRMPLDVNGGHFPFELYDVHGYFANDPEAATTNLMYPADNLLHPPDPSWAATHAGVPQQSDDLMTFYERATKTLVLRPVLPLHQESQYAVILMRTLKGVNGLPVESPFPGINHTLQTEELRPLLKFLAPGQPLADLKLGDIAFAWAFTTQTATRELEALHDGLNGSGPLAALAERFPVVQVGAGGTQSLVAPFASHTLPAAGDPPATAYIVTGDELTAFAQDPQLGPVLFGVDPAAVDALIVGLKYLDYFVMGQFSGPNLLDDPGVKPGDEAFRVDLHAGTAQAAPTPLYFFAAVPKATALHQPPFPVVLYGHGYTSARFEGPLLGGGTLAKFGLGMFALDAYGHGLAIDPLLAEVVRSIMVIHGLGPFADALFLGRARDLDNDGVADSGGDFWTASTFHTRDVVRQSIVDWFQAVRLLRSWDGKATMQVPAGDGKTRTWIAGDFNHDGIPDLGGPVIWPEDVKKLDGTIVHKAGEENTGSAIYSIGSSLGGILASIFPAVEPAVVAAAPVSGGSGLTYVALRSTLGSVVNAVFLEVMGPIVFNCPWSVSSNGCNGGAADAKPSLVFEVARVNNDAQVPIAPAQIGPGDIVTACNQTQLGSHSLPSAAEPLPDGCKRATADANGNIRISLAADRPDLTVTETPQAAGLPDDVKVQVNKQGDPIVISIARASDGTITLVNRYGFDSTFVGVPYKTGQAINAPARGYGTARNTADLRRLLQLSQMILDPGDPVNYAPHYFQDPLPVRHGVPANVLVVATVGDKLVPVATGIATGRAAGLIEVTANDPDYGKPIDRVLIDSGAVEAVDRLNRYASPDVGPRAKLAGHIRCDDWVDHGGNPQPSQCGSSLQIDPTGFSCDEQAMNCTDDFGAARLSPPLRAQLQRQTASGVSALLLPYLDPHGQHAVHNPQPDQAFDMNGFMLNVAGRYFESGGKILTFDRCQSQLYACPWIPPPPQ